MSVKKQRMTRKQMRLMWIGAIGLVLSVALGLSLFAMRDGIAFAMNPAELRASDVKPGERVRLFGLVENGSIVRGEGLAVSFRVAMEGEAYRVTFNDVLPDLFREGQGIIAEGTLVDGQTFAADTVLAKHDENYVPREFSEKMKKNRASSTEPSAGATK